MLSVPLMDIHANRSASFVHQTQWLPSSCSLRMQMDGNNCIFDMRGPRKWRRIKSNLRWRLFLEQTNKGEKRRWCWKCHPTSPLRQHQWEFLSFSFLLLKWIFCFLVNLISSLWLLCLQIDLEPVGRVYVIIDLAGSSSEGKTDLFRGKCDGITWTERY